MGVVYQARQVSLDRIVAVKMLLFGALSSQETVQRFRIEAAAAASLQHPHIVAIYEVGFNDGQHFFAMEYVAGRSLAAIVKDGPLPAKRAATYLKAIAEAIHYAHERGILHRDLKPSNVLIDPFDQPKVTDFGLAKRLETEMELTLSGQLLGSPNYMPPEQAAAALAEELGRFLNSQPVQARPIGPAGKAWRWCRRKPALATLGALVVVLVLVVVLGAPIAIIRINRPRVESERRSYSSDMRL